MSHVLVTGQVDINFEALYCLGLMKKFSLLLLYYTLT